MAGVGFAAVRDMASAMKYQPGVIAPGRLAYMYGSSQTGRAIRQIVYDGFTIDEQGRKVFDAAFIKTGGASLARFNERFALVNSLGVFTETQFPFQYQVTTDPVTGKRDGLGARIPAGLEPKIFTFDTGSEYWDKGRLGALRHASVDGTADLPDAPNVRVYYVAGARHGSGSVPAGDGGGQFPSNPLDYSWAERGLMAALDAWAREGKEPPDSRHPRFADGTMVHHQQLAFPAVPGVRWPTDVPGGYRWDVDTTVSAMPFLLSQVDADGNETGGIRLPEQQVPLGTMTGWQFRNPRIGAPDTLMVNSGAYIPFPATRAERAKAGDPRLAIEERYTSRAGLSRQGRAGGSAARPRALHPRRRRAGDRRRRRQALGLADGRRADAAAAVACRSARHPSAICRPAATRPGAREPLRQPDRRRRPDRNRPADAIRRTDGAVSNASPDRRASRGAAMALQVRRLTNPDRTEITDTRRRWMARFTDGATTVTSSGPRRRFSEPTAADAVTHTVWVRTLPKPFTGTVDEAWLTAALQANALRVPDVLAIAMQYIRGAAALLDGPLQIAGDAEYGPLVNGKREEGADFNDYLGVTWTYADAVDPPETRQFRSLDCSGFVRMVWGYRHSLPGQPRRDRVPLTLAPTSSRRAMPRRAFEICQSAPGVVTIANDGGQVQDLSALAVGDLVFFDADDG